MIKSKSMFFSLFLIFLITSTNTIQLTFEQFLQSTPKTFGLLTVTHARNGIYTYFNKHLQKYATMDCPQITQISVVWNNDKTPEQVGLVQKSEWKRPVYFIKTPHNSMDFRYLIPKESTAQVFFSMDDDVLTTCQQLRKSFSLWREKAIGDIGPLMSYAPRGFDFTSAKQSFKYADPQKARFYSISLVGVAWISRFYFDLYNAQSKIWQVFQMRQIVRSKNNCDDIALNFLVNYFFPQLISSTLGGNVSMEIHPNSQSLTRTHYSFRNQCLKKFVQILGYNPLRIINKADPPNTHRFVSQSSNYIIYLRRKQLWKKFMLIDQDVAQKQDGNMFSIPTQQQKNDEEKLKQANSLNSQLKSEMEELKKKIQFFKSSERSMIQKNKQLQSDFQKYLKQKRQSQRTIKTITTVDQTIVQILKSMDLIYKIGLFVGVTLILLFICLICKCLNKPTNQRIKFDKPNKTNQYSQNQMVQYNQVSSQEKSAENA